MLIKPGVPNVEGQGLSGEQLAGVAGCVSQEGGWDDPRERNRGNKKDSPKDV